MELRQSLQFSALSTGTLHLEPLKDRHVKTSIILVLYLVGSLLPDMIMGDGLNCVLSLEDCTGKRKFSGTLNSVVRSRVQKFPA